MQATRPIPAPLLVTLPVLLAACIGDPAVIQHDLPECADPMIDTAGWQTRSEVTFDYLVPPYYTWVPGANRWENGQSWIKAELLAPGQFPSTPAVSLSRYSECEADIGTVRDVFVQLGLTGPDAPWGSGWYSSATYEQVPIDSEGAEGTVLIEAWTNEIQDEVDRQIGVYWNVVFRPVGN